MANAPIFCVGDGLQVGQVDFNYTNLASRLIPGRATINGPLVVGAKAPTPVPTANASFGPGFITPVSLESIGITNIFGTLNTYAISNILGLSNIFGVAINNALRLSNGVDLKNALNLGNGTTIFNGPVQGTLIGAITVVADKGIFASVAAPFKQFNIAHPSKPGYRLVHSCLEGPEIGVYYRGLLKNNNQIILPDYWKGLVDLSTITVHLTSYSNHQELFVKEISENDIIIENKLNSNINCSYIIYAERIDVEKLKVEYKEK